MRTVSRIGIARIGLAMLGVGAVLHAARAAEIEEVLVTARKQAETLISVPVACPTVSIQGRCSWTSLLKPHSPFEISVGAVSVARMIPSRVPMTAKVSSARKLDMDEA